MPIVSIILPAYNAEKTLLHAISSVQHQVYGDWELIIVDDGSKDNTLFLAKEAQSHDSRIQVISIRNSGVSAARNTGLDHASGDYIAFLDADDAMDPLMLSQLQKQMTKETDLVCSGYSIMTAEHVRVFDQCPNDGEWTKLDWHAPIGNLLDIKAFNPLWNKLFRRSIIAENRLHMDVSVSMGEDYLFVVDYLNHMQKMIRVCNKPLYHYALSANGLQTTANGNQDLNRRLKQIVALRKLFEKNLYPMDAIQRETARIFYTTLIESQSIDETLNEIYTSHEFKAFSQAKLSGIKNRFFLKTLQAHNKCLIKIALFAFQKAKQISNKSYDWR